MLFEEARFEYKSYKGAIEFDKEEKYKSNIIGLKNTIISTFDIVKREKMSQEFENVVQNYLKSCKKLNLEPEKGFNDLSILYERLD